MSVGFHVMFKGSVYLGHVVVSPQRGRLVSFVDAGYNMKHVSQSNEERRQLNSSAEMKVYMLIYYINRTESRDSEMSYSFLLTFCGSQCRSY